ncbi:Rieske (2Fe-2S) domain-containing protein [Tepidicaulis marinus]|uniref:Rieske (2Fe-2S) domain-containing protein n=1 Tax=Tepidicaulis marinus TaxID=1333998 RepID=A0A081BCG5_9HYPH|nr:aromatic ring-hydroxylating dioxygenase subunit alpha [Tepidicaulis marinus]GAK45733.1 Rieske (2Fe-2S) domain-containing protein [Tepidicaulis marinus]
MNMQDLLARGRKAVPPRLAAASSLPPGFYTSKDVHALEVERVFRRHWQAVGHVSEVPEPGSYFRFDLAGEPLLIVRGADGTVRALSAVCRHRWMLLKEDAGKAASFSCPYHKWTYALDGKLIGAPLMEGAEGFAKENCALPSFACEIWNGLIFVNLDGTAPPLREQVAPLSLELAPWRMEEMELVGRLDFGQAYNWKVLVDNFMEAYHHFAIHPETFETHYPAAITYVDDAQGPFAALRIPHKGNEQAETLFTPLPGIPDKARRSFSVFNVYPSCLFAVLADAVIFYRLKIETEAFFQLSIYLLVHPRSLDVEEAEARKEIFLEATRAVHHEDIIACEGVQKGLASGSASPGRLSHLEAAIHQHQRWLLSELERA